MNKVFTFGIFLSFCYRHFCAKELKQAVHGSFLKSETASAYLKMHETNFNTAIKDQRINWKTYFLIAM